MRRIFLTSIFFLSFALVGRAQEASAAPTQDQAPKAATPAPVIPEADRPTKEQLLQLFDTMRIRSQMATMLEAMPKAVQQQLRSEERSVESKLPADSTLTADQKAAVEKVTVKYMDAAFKLYPVDEMLEDLVAVYQRHLTREDVDAITVFYKSPAGQHLLENQPAMMKEMMPETTRKMQERARALTASYDKDLKDALNTTAPPSK